MGKAEKAPPFTADHDFLSFEVDRLIHSAKTRLEQQRIHIAELGGHGRERLNAKRRLKLMQAAFERLLAYQAQWHPKKGRGGGETG